MPARLNAHRRALADGRDRLKQHGRDNLQTGMKKRTLDVEVHWEPPTYWAQVTEYPGCFATGRTLDELLEALRDNLALYLEDDEPERLLARITQLKLEVEADLRPEHVDEITQPTAHRKRQAHRDDWPPQQRFRTPE